MPGPHCELQPGWKALHGYIPTHPGRKPSRDLFRGPVDAFDDEVKFPTGWSTILRISPRVCGGHGVKGDAAQGLPCLGGVYGRDAVSSARRLS